MGLKIEYPLYLVFLVPVAITLYFYWKQSKFMPRLEKYTIIGIRFIVFLLLILALSLPHILYPVKGITAVFIMDRSESVKNQEAAMFEMIEEAVHKMGPEDRYAIVSVAEEAQITQSLSKREKGIISTSIIENTSFTNLAEGIQLASSLLSDDINGRIVLLSDGNENMGDVKQQVHIMRDQHIPVDVFPVNPSIGKDVAIEKFHTPANLYLGENGKMSLNITSTIDTNSRLIITKNNEIVVDESMAVKKGRNSYTFNHLIETPGMHTFKAEIISDGDDVPQNNQSFAISSVKGAPAILLVEGVEGEGSNIETALQATGLHVTKTQPKLLPTSLVGFLDYESIIFSNVSATEVTQNQMEMIESAVKDFGAGFVMTGGNNSFGLGGYFQTPIERLLPVDMDLKGKKELPSLGLIIVLDRSGSMSGYKLDLAKEAAARSVELLREKDTLGFIAFDDRPWEIIETGPLNDKQEAADKIRSITAGGGTEIFTSLQQAYIQLGPLKLQRKHIILLTDGQSHGDYSQIISQGLENNVTLSTVAIGSDADRSLLERLASEGTGRFYEVQDASTIPSILSRETVLTTRTYIEDNPFYPKYFEGNNWSPLFQQGVPQMNAYVATDLKGRAEEILKSGKDDPVLSRWKYGLGKSIAWTTDVSGAWSGEWPTWENWPTLWNEMITWTLPSYQGDLYDIKQSVDGKNIILDIISTSSDIVPMDATVIDEKGNNMDTKIRMKAPGEHEVSFSADPGIYFLQLTKSDGDTITGTFKSGIVVPYSKEFELQNENSSLLKEIADLGNGKILTSPEEAFRKIDRDKYEKQPFFMPLILLAFLLFFIEIAIRRFGLTPVLEKVRFIRMKREEVQKERKRHLEKTYTRLKKVSSTNTKQTIYKKIPQVEEKNGMNNQPSIETIQQKHEADYDQAVNDGSDRLKRLLDAKKRSGR